MPNKDVIADLVAQVTLDGTKFQQGIGKVNRQLKLVKEEMDTAKFKTKQFGESTDNLKNKSSILAKQLKLQKASVEMLDKAYQEAVASGGAFSKTAQNLAIRLEKAKRQMMGTEKQISDVNRELVEQNGLLVTNSGLWGKNFADLRESIGKNIDALGTLQRTMGGFLIASGVGFGAAVYSAATFEQALADVKAISGATGEDMAKLADLAKELGESTRYSGKQVLEGAQELIKAGISLEDVMGGALKGALDLATAGELELADAAQVASTALNAFEQDNLSVSDAANILAGAANASATDVHEMQIGLAQASAVASASGLTFEETATALAVLAQSGLRGSDAGTSLRTMLLRLVPETNKAKDAMKELGLMTKDGSNNFFDANGELKDFNEIVQILHDSLDDLNPEQRSAALKELFGQDAYRAGAIFFKEAADGINEMNEAMKETTAAEVAAIRMDTFLGELEELKSTLATLGIDVAEESMDDLSDTVKELTGWVRDLDPDMVALGLKAVGAAAGFGLMATTLLRVGRGLMLLSANPVGLAITGISLLVGAFVGLNGAMKENEKISFEAVQAKQKEVETTDQLIDRYTQLQAQNQLSNEEMLKFLDIQAQIEQTASPAAIEALKDAQNKLLEKSGLTNEEMNEFLKLNDTIIEKAPTTQQAISSEGEAYALNTDAIREMNAAKRETMLMEAEGVLIDGLFKQAEVEREITKLVKARNELNNQITSQKGLLIEKNAAIREQEAKIHEIENSSRETKAGELAIAENNLQVLLQERENIKGKIVDLGEEVQTKNESLEKSRKTVQEIEKAKLQYEQIILAQVGLNGKKGEGLQILDSEISKLQTQKSLLDAKLQKGEISLGQYQNQTSELDTQIGRLRNAQGELKEINELAGKTIYDKDVRISTSPSVRSLNNQLSETVWKTISLKYASKGSGGHPVPVGYASGTDSHPGGPAVVGEEGPELVQQGNKLSLQSFGLMPNLMSGAKVFTAEETNRILSAMNRLPGYASGTGTMRGEADRIISSLGRRPSVSQEQATQLVVVEVPVHLDSYEIARITTPHINTLQSDETLSNMRYGGVKKG